MTTHNLTTAPRVPASPGSMAAHIPTRRRFLGGALAMPAIMAASAVAAVPAPALGTSRELVALIAKADRLAAVAKAHDENVYSPAVARLQAAIDAVPHVEMAADPNAFGNTVVRTTASESIVAMNRTIVATARPSKFTNAAAIAFERRFRAAHLRRERTIATIRKGSGIARVFADSDALELASSNAQYAVADYPVQTTADLSAKLAFIIEHEMSEGIDWLPEILADAQRLAGKEG